MPASKSVKQLMNKVSNDTDTFVEDWFGTRTSRPTLSTIRKCDTETLGDLRQSIAELSAALEETERCKPKPKPRPKR